MKSVMKAVLIGACSIAPVGHVWADAQGSPYIEVLAKSTKMWTGDPLPAYPDGTPELSVLRITIPPNSRLPLHMHPVMNVAYVAQGSVKILTTDGKVLSLKEQDVMIEIVDIWHEGINEGDTPTELIVFYAGVLDEPVTIYDNPAERLQPIGAGTSSSD